MVKTDVGHTILGASAHFSGRNHPPKAHLSFSPDPDRRRSGLGGSVNDSGSGGALPVNYRRSVRSVLLDEFVVEPEEQERSGPLADEQRLVLSPAEMQPQGNPHGRERQSKKRARRDLRCDVFNSGRYLVFPNFTFSHTIICQMSPPLPCFEVHVVGCTSRQIGGGSWQPGMARRKPGAETVTG
jgi:hypothetical protein